MTATAAVAVFFLLLGQWQNAEASRRDSSRKVAINTIHYYLREVYYQENKAYPAILTAQDLKAINEELIKDPAGRPIGAHDSDLRYTASKCAVNDCQHYELRASLEKEDDFIRSNED